jgi:hypothetical protein
MAILVKCLVALRNEFNTLAPNRDKGADGWIGDAAHQQETSDHNPDETGRTPFEDADNINEVHALDIDKDLGGGLDLDVYVERIRRNHQSAKDNRLQNIIWLGRVASRSWGWTWAARPSIGHFDHAHFSARYTTAQENDESPWGVLEEDMDTQDVLNIHWGRGDDQFTLGEVVPQIPGIAEGVARLAAQQKAIAADIAALKADIAAIKAAVNAPKTGG